MSNLRSPVYFDGMELFDGSWAVLSGSSEPKIEPVPRSLAINVKESLKYDRKIVVHGWKILPDEYTRKDYESFLLKMAEFLGCRKGDLIVSNNTYPNAVLDGWSIEDSGGTKYFRAELTFDISEQVQNNQFTKVSDKIKNYWGRAEAIFTVKNYMSGVSSVFEFRQDIICTPQLMPKADKGTNDEANKRFSGMAGLELDCEGWCVYQETYGSREYLEAYVYNMLCGPLGRIGTLALRGNTYNNTFLQNISTQDTGPSSFIRYNLKFLLSPQC